MLRAGASLPAAIRLLGHNAVTMTLRYVQVTENDLQRKYRNARQSMTTPYAIPDLPRTPSVNV
jgi:site-specific recombinase XerD